MKLNLIDIIHYIGLSIVIIMWLFATFFIKDNIIVRVAIFILGGVAVGGLVFLSKQRLSPCDKCKYPNDINLTDHCENCGHIF